MKCPECNYENTQEAKFCQSCGTKLEGKPCPDCGSVNRQDVNFCEECGYAFSAKDAAEQAPTPASEAKLPPPAPKAPDPPPDKAPTLEQVSTPASEVLPPPPPPDPPSDKALLPEQTPTLASEVKLPPSPPPPSFEPEIESPSSPPPQPEAAPAVPPEQPPTPTSASAAASSSAPPPPPQVVIIKEEQKREKRRLPGWLWAILGVVLTLTCLCSLLWFNVVDLPEGVIANLPDPIGEVVKAIDEGDLDDLPIIGGPADIPGGDWEREFICNFELEFLRMSYYNITTKGQGDIEFVFKDGPIWDPSWEIDFVNVIISGNSYRCRWDPDNKGDNKAWCDDVPIRDIQGEVLNVKVEIPNKICTIFNDSVTFKDFLFEEEEPAEPEEVECASINVTSIIFNWTNPTTLQVTVDRDEPWEVGWWMEITLGGANYWPDPGNCEISGGNPTRFICQITVEDSYSGVGEIKLLSPETCPYHYDASVPEAALCPAGQTYYPGWPYNGGCCTDGCWCKQDGVWGCWTTCGKKCE